jgi:hypothetical protein
MLPVGLFECKDYYDDRIFMMTAPAEIFRLEETMINNGRAIQNHRALHRPPRHGGHSCIFV